MQRLLDRQLTRSTGALTILQLAVEANVKRWVLTSQAPPASRTSSTTASNTPMASPQLPNTFTPA
jgi:hypothetical protein